MPKLNNFFDKTETVEKILTKKMHPQLVSINKLEESKLQYRDIPQEDVEKLADLIELDGEVLQPLLVRKAGGDTYEILAGHKRYRACRYLTEEKGLGQFSMIPCYVKAMSDAQAEFAVYSTNGYNRKTDYEIMREVEGMSRLLKENPELFPEAASGRLVEKLASIMNMSKTVVQEYKTIAGNLSDDAMEKFRKEEITKESAKTLASLSHEEQRQIIAAGVVDTKEIKKAATKVKEPNSEDIIIAFELLAKSYIYANDDSPEEFLKEYCGKQYAGGSHDNCNYSCTPRGISINGKKEITWHVFVAKANELGLWQKNDNFPTDREIVLAFKHLKPENVNRKTKEELEEYFKVHCRHRYYGSSDYSIDCSVRGVKINNKAEITWNKFIKDVIRLGLFTSASNSVKPHERGCITGENPNGNCVCCGENNVKCCSECDSACNGRCGWVKDTEDNTEEQLPGQDSILNHPEYLPDDNAISDNENKVRNEYLTDKLSGVKAIGRCPKCLGAVAYLTNPTYCGKCGNKLDWTFVK